MSCVRVSHVVLGHPTLALALLGHAGCNWVFGIAETRPQDASIGLDATDVDLDDDFVLDVVDNCDEIPNPMQEDQDRDDIGDVCDPCPTG